MEYIILVSGVVVSVISVIFCLLLGKGAPHKMLVFFFSMIGVVAVVGFVGEAVLNLFGMGWRRTLVNIMVTLCIGFFIATLCCCVWQLIALKDAFMAWGYVPIVLAIFITLQGGFLHFTLSPDDELRTYNDETVVCVNEDPGSAQRRYYTHINGLVHGKEILQVGWGETRPLDYTS